MTLYMGLVGCGTHAAHHANHYGNDFATYGVWDPNPTAMEGIKSEKRFDTLEALLAAREIDAVLICSPDEFHLAQIEMALAAGKHVYCEKPLLVPGQDLAHLEAVFDLAAEKKLVLTSCHPRRFDRPFMWLKSKLHEDPKLDMYRGLYGKVVSFDFDFSYHKPSNAWKHTRSLLLDHLNHEVDLVNFLFGVQGFDAWKLQDGFDQYEVVGKRDDGIVFHFRGTRRLEAHTYPEWCRVRFERAEVELDMMRGIANIVDHEMKWVVAEPKLAIDYEGRLQRAMKDFHRQIEVLRFDFRREGWENPPLSRSEMLMNTEAGIILQNEGVQRVNVRP